MTCGKSCSLLHAPLKVTFSPTFYYWPADDSMQVQSAAVRGALLNRGIVAHHDSG